NNKLAHFGNQPTLDKKAAAILNISAPTNKSYEAIIKRYEMLARDNNWANQDGFTISLTAFYGLTCLGELLPSNQADGNKV
ncbi:22926_t:CDS:2, partial [Racocetra persica]